MRAVGSEVGHSDGTFHRRAADSIDLLLERGAILDRVMVWHHDAFVRTTLNIADALLKELREQAAATGRPFREVLEETIAAGLAQRRNPATSRRYRVQPHALHLKPGFRNLSLNQVFDQLEAEEDAR